MPRSRPAYSEEFRRRMIELVRAGRSPASLAREFEPTARSIRQWVRQADRDAGQRTDGLTTTDQEELRQLRRENKRLREEQLTDQIRTIHTRSRGTYGAPRIQDKLVLDVWSRRIVGWAMETHLRTPLVLAALNMAITQRQTYAVIHHSDQGCQYTALPL